jgi:iron complex outermembrane receptor protein
LGGYVRAKLIEPKDDIYFKTNLTLGSFSYINGNLTFNLGNEKFQFLTSVSKTFSKVYKTGEGKYFTEYLTGSSAYKTINKTAFDNTNILVKSNLNINNENKVQILFGYDYNKDVLYPYLLMDAMYDMTYKTGLTFYNKSIDLKALVYFNSVKHDMRDTYRVSSNMALYGDYSMRTLAKTKTTGFRISKGLKIADTKIKIGIDGYIKNWKADNRIAMLMMGTPVDLDNRGMIPDVDIKDLGLFVKAEKKIQNIVLSGGLRFDYTKYEASKSAFGRDNYDLYSQYYTNYSYSSSDKYISGNILLSYKLDNKSDIYIGYGHSVRVPNQEELYIALKKPMAKADWVGNPNLSPTKNDEIDLGVNYRVNLTSIKVNLFYSKLTDYIYLTKIRNLANTKDAMSYKNIDAYIYGGNVELLQSFNNGFYGKVGLAYQVGKKDNGYTTDNDLVEIPPLKLISGLGFSKNNWDTYLEAIYSAKQKNIDEELNEVETPPYLVMNFRTSYSTNKFSFTFGVDNIFDNMYYTYLSYKRDPFSSGVKVPEPGRFIYMSMGLTF